MPGSRRWDRNRRDDPEDIEWRRRTEMLDPHDDYVSEDEFDHGFRSFVQAVVPTHNYMDWHKYSYHVYYDEYFGPGELMTTDFPGVIYSYILGLEVSGDDDEMDCIRIDANPKERTELDDD